jgi:DNA-binding transcriptional regulator PaaX
MKLLTFFRIKRTSDDGRNLIFNEDVSHNWGVLPAALIKMVKDGVIESFAEEKDAYRISILTKSIEDIW